MEAEGFRELYPEDETLGDETTSFIDNPSGGLDSYTQQSVNFHNDPMLNANAILEEGGLPDIDAIIANKGKDKNIDPKLLAAMVSVEKPRGESGLKALIRAYNEYVRGGGDYEKFVTENFLTREQLDDYLKQAPAPSTDTPSVPISDRNKIDLKLSELNVSSDINHARFKPEYDQFGELKSLSVNTNKGPLSITQKDPRLFKERPGIPKGEYQTLFGFDREEYTARVRARNNVVRDYNQSRTTEMLRLAKPTLSQEFHNPAFNDPDLMPTPIGESADWQKKPLGERFKSAAVSMADSMSESVRSLLTRFKPSEYQRLPTDDDDEVLQMDTLSPEQRQETGEELEDMYGRLRKLGPEMGENIDDMIDKTRRVKALEGKSTLTDGEAEQLEDLKQTLAGDQATLDLKLDEIEQISEKKKNILKLLGVGVGTTAVGGIIAGIFEAVANALGSDTVKDLIPKSSDPKDIAASGIGKLIIKKLEDLAAYFHEQFLNSTGMVKAFWHMMENAVKFMQDHMWILIATVLALVAVEINKKR